MLIPPPVSVFEAHAASGAAARGIHSFHPISTVLSPLVAEFFEKIFSGCNHNHRPCRWFAQAPLGPITSRAYRLIESSFYCMMRPTAIEIAAWRILLFTSLDYLPFLIAPYQLLSRLVPRFARIFFLGIAKAFWNHRHCRWFSLYNKPQTSKSACLRFLCSALQHCLCFQKCGAECFLRFALQWKDWE